jgi:hypothetical protein
MMVWVQIGNSTNVGIFVLRLLFFFDIFVVGDVVNPGFVLFAVCVDHRGSGTTTRITFTLHVAFLLAVTADNVWGTGAVVASGVGARGRASWGRVGVFARQLLTTNKRNLFDFFVSQCKFLRPFAVILNGLNFSGGLHTFDSVDENPGKYSIFFASSVEKRNVGRTSHTVVVVEGLGDVGHVDVGSSGEGLGVLFVERRLQG